MLRFDRLTTPPGDGDTLIEPHIGSWLELIAANVSRRSAGLALAGIGIDDERRRVRSEILGLSADATVIATGHQPEFIHPGVWAKNVIVCRFARACQAEGIDLVVDNDAPASAGLRVPVRDDEGFFSTREVTFTQAPSEAAHEGRPALNAGAIEKIKSELRDALGDRLADSMLPVYLDGLSPQRDDKDFVDQHIRARHAVDRRTGADLRAIRVGGAFGGPFLADLILDAERFAAAYNGALADYRREHRVREANRPLPDLARQDDRVETALWACQPGRPRCRLSVSSKRERIDLFANGKAIGSVSADELRRDADRTLLALEPWVIRPRALTLTLWARLLVCDLLVHGIGGAKYDRITDGIIHRYYRCEPPAYTCVSATLRLPLEPFDVSTADLIQARRLVRDWKYNPDRYLTAPPADLLERRQELIHQADTLRQNRGDRLQRRDNFLAIREINRRLTGCEPEVGGRLADRRDRTARRLTSNEVSLSREYFYALQPADRLAMLADRLARQTALSDRS